MKSVYTFRLLIIGAIAAIAFCSCQNSTKESAGTKFWGPGVCFIFSKPQNGYKVSAFYKEESYMCIWHLQRGDSIDFYIERDGLPLGLLIGQGDINLNSDTTIIINDDDVIKDYFIDLSFYDVDFDGEKEFILSSGGYNTTSYQCYDLVQGYKDGYRGFLQPMGGEVYGRLIEGDMCQDSFTEFDEENKTIHILECIGCVAEIEVWAKPIKGKFDRSAEVKAYKKIERDFWSNGEEQIITYELIGDSLKQTSKVIQKSNRRNKPIAE